MLCCGAHRRNPAAFLIKKRVDIPSLAGFEIYSAIAVSKARV
jgi:hypothetical protein